MRIIERDRRVDRYESDAAREERWMLTQQLRKAQEEKQTAFDRGFEAAVIMVRAGASLERLEAAAGIPVARGTRDFADENTDVDALPFVEADTDVAERII